MGQANGFKIGSLYEKQEKERECTYCTCSTVASCHQIFDDVMCTSSSTSTSTVL